MRQLSPLSHTSQAWTTSKTSTRSSASRCPSLIRTLSCTPVSHQTRPRLRTTATPASIIRPILDPNNPYLPSTAILSNTAQADSSNLTPSLSEDSSAQLPIIVPLAALDPRLSRKLKNSPIKAAENQVSDPLIAQQVRKDGETQLNQIVEDWVRNELNVMGTVREETIEIFLKLLLNPSTLAPLADKLQLQTAGRDQPVKSSGFTPRRLVPPATVADEELLQLLQYLIGTIYRSLLPRLDSLSNQKFKKYVINLLHVGLTKECIKQLLIRSSQLSGQDAIGSRKGFSRAEIRVAQLGIWGSRRSKKISKLVPEQIIHRTRFRCRKAEVLKQRWIQEELKMIHWRKRLMNITAFQQNEVEAENSRRLDHSNRVKQWRQERQQNFQSNVPLTSPLSPTSTKTSEIFSKLFNFWPFNSSIVTGSNNPNLPRSS